LCNPSFNIFTQNNNFKWSLFEVSKLSIELRLSKSKSNGRFIVFCRDVEHMNRMIEESKNWFGSVNSNIDMYIHYVQQRVLYLTVVNK